MKNHRLLALAATVGLLIGGGPATSHTSSISGAFCEDLGPYIKTLAAEITVTPTGHRILSLRCYID